MDFSKFLTYQKAIMWLGLAMLVILFVFVVSDNTKTYRLRQKAQQLTTENDKLKTEIADLNNKVSYYNTDEYKQKLAREVLNLQQPGESVIIVPTKSGNSGIADQDTRGTTATSPPKSNFKTWMDFLFRS